ncbi:hypothetical protein P9911_029585 [Klebsiella oxytoca]|uniref:hypothetical protein n=1 Tax=Klebsiella oxytoca TaxID=571 RepID=UPI002550005B|nr:hypothetical protein [Klebsiella oxytoca]MEC5509956.1 hypothetical protein [Klebsiella oxytoca]
MEKIFYSRGKGRVTKSLEVFSDGEQYKLHFLIFDRTNPSKAERAAGEKEKRFVVLDEQILVPVSGAINPADYPLPELVQQFMNFIAEGGRS